MVSSSFLSALVATSVLSLVLADDPSTVDSIPTPTASVALNAMTDIGCFSTGVPLQDHGSYIYQSPGNCQPICILLKKPVMGLVDGTNCWCGDLIPPKNSQTDNSTCDTPCAGYDKSHCGGASKWWISLTGLTKNRIDYYDASSASSSKSSAPAAANTQAPETVVLTASNIPTHVPSSNSNSNSNSGPNKAGIAAGVVVGVVGLAAIIGGVLFYLRNKRRRAVEEEYRRQAAVNSFVGGKLHTSNSSMTDSRLDPEFMQRRASNGSIADNEDYSRRILKVTNPDGH